MYLGLAALGTFLYPRLPALGTFLYPGLAALGTKLSSDIYSANTFLRFSKAENLFIFLE